MKNFSKIVLTWQLACMLLAVSSSWAQPGPLYLPQTHSYLVNYGAITHDPFLIDFAARQFVMIDEQSANTGRLIKRINPGMSILTYRCLVSSYQSFKNYYTVLNPDEQCFLHACDPAAVTLSRRNGSLFISWANDQRYDQAAGYRVRLSQTDTANGAWLQDTLVTVRHAVLDSLMADGLFLSVFTVPDTNFAPVRYSPAIKIDAARLPAAHHCIDSIHTAGYAANRDTLALRIRADSTLTIDSVVVQLDLNHNRSLTDIGESFALTYNAPFWTMERSWDRNNYNAGAGVNQGCRTPQNETAIAVNPANPQNLVAGANDYRDCCILSGGTQRNDGSGWVYVSFDGGLSWFNRKLPGLGFSGNPQGVFKKVTSVGDPAIAFGKNNTVYYANIGFNRVDESDAIFVSVSHDGGTNWDPPVLVANSGGATFFNDKVWIGADPNSGMATISWTRFKSNPKYGYIESPIVASTSTNFGATWASWVDVSGQYKYNQGSVPVYGNDGSIYVSFEGAVAADGYNDYNIVAKSTNGGATFTQTVVSRNVDENFPIFGGRGVLTGLHFRTNTFPSLTVDRVTGKLYLAWADNSLGNSTTTSAQVFVQSSVDGVSWTAKLQLTTTPEDKIYPWVAANAGNVIVSYYTREFAGAASLQIDYAYAKSNDGGATWSASTRITEQSSDPGIQFSSGAFIGDYTGVAVGSDNVAHPLWTDFRGNPGLTSPNQDAVTARIPL